MNKQDHRQEDAEVLDMPDPSPRHTYLCWNCKTPVDNITCMGAGYDEDGCPNGYICNQCGLHLGDMRNRNI